MRRVDFKIAFATKAGKKIMVSIKAYDYGYGLFIHRCLLNSEKLIMGKSWNVSAKCGYGIWRGFDLRRDAETFCNSIKELGNWELEDVDEVRKSSNTEKIFNSMTRWSK